MMVVWKQTHIQNKGPPLQSFLLCFTAILTNCCSYFSGLTLRLLINFLYPYLPAHPPFLSSSLSPFYLTHLILSRPLFKSFHMLISVGAGGKPQVDPAPPLGLAAVPGTQLHVATLSRGGREGGSSLLCWWSGGFVWVTWLWPWSRTRILCYVRALFVTTGIHSALPTLCFISPVLENGLEITV